jgi:hypothetical protein
MAISITGVVKTTFGNKKVLIITGSFASGDTSGTYDCGLVAVDLCMVSYQAAAYVIGVSASAGTLTFTTENPGATKVFQAIVIGH